MKRERFGWDYPPGVTDADFEDPPEEEEEEEYDNMREIDDADQREWDERRENEK